jgi:hypothetical protein
MVSRRELRQPLEEVVTTLQEALKEYTRERVPLDWANTQNNLGNTLARLGEREAGTGAQQRERMRFVQVAFRFAREAVRVTELMEANPEYAEAKDLIQQARRVLDSAFEDLLRKAQIMGLTIFKEALKLDPWLWLNCEKEWGQGPGYRDRVAQWNREWVGAESRRDLEQELWEVVTREWGTALERLSSLLETDAAVPAKAAGARDGEREIAGGLSDL